MKVYFNSKDKKIQAQEKLIEKLKDENKCLREQIEKLNPADVENKIALAEAYRTEYLELIKQLKELKDEYLLLNKDVKNNNKLIKRFAK
nr:MAG TPA: 5-azacytidine-induced protein 2 [Bacteriophage sp.]